MRVRKTDVKKAITLHPVGYVSSPVIEPVDENWGQVISRIIIRDEYAGGLLGLEGFSHAIIVTYLHKAQYDPSRHLVRRPRGLQNMPELGIFSQRSKDRPNPVGITVVTIQEVGEDYLEVQGLDAVHNTPVLDIKPCYPHYDRIDSISTPEWVNELMEDYF